MMLYSTILIPFIFAPFFFMHPLFPCFQKAVSILTSLHMNISSCSPSVGIQIPTLGEQLEIFSEEGNSSDGHTVVITRPNSQEVVGHLPWEISAMVWYFLRQKGKITDKVVGSRKCSMLQEQGTLLPIICTTPLLFALLPLLLVSIDAYCHIASNKW